MPTKNSVHELARDCIAVRIRLLGRFITSVYDEFNRPHGVRVAQVNILTVVGRAGPLTPSEVARILVMDRSTLSRDLESLLEEGWLRSLPGKDRRSYSLQLTPAGQAKLEAIMPSWRSAQAEVERRLGKESIAGIFAAVDRLRAEQASEDQSQSE
jgi:DNA-binding MarR family transcriptional regulator